MLTAFQCPECGSHTVVDAALPEVTCGSCRVTSAQEVQGSVYRPPPPPPPPQSRPPPPPVRPMVPQPQPHQYVTPTPGAGARKGAAFAALIVFGVLGAGVWAAIRNQKEQNTADVGPRAPEVAQKAAVGPVGPLHWRQSGPPVVATLDDRQVLIGRVEQGETDGIAAFTTRGEVVWRANVENAGEMVPVGSVLLIERIDGSVVAVNLATGGFRGKVSSLDQLAGECDGGDVYRCLERYQRPRLIPALQGAAAAQQVPRVRQVDVEWFTEHGDYALAIGAETRGSHREVLVLTLDARTVWKIDRPESNGFLSPAAQFAGDGILFATTHGTESGTIMRLDLGNGSTVWSQTLGDASDGYRGTYLGDGMLFAVTQNRLAVIDATTGETFRIGD
jgi:hypothetical protein